MRKRLLTITRPYATNGIDRSISLIYQRQKS